MTFSRTASGIANHHLFTGSTFTVYIEGDADADPSSALDVAFWRIFFRSAFPQERFSFRQLGGKPHVLAMARKIIDQSIGNSLCAIDADYSHIHPVPDDERIFRTRGYGVENDVISAEVFEGVLEAAVPGLASPPTAAHEIWSLIQETCRLDWQCIVSDQIASCHSSSTLDRANPRGDLTLDTDDLPLRLRRISIKSRCRAAVRAQNIKPPTEKLVGSVKTMPAHHFYFLAFHTFIRYLKNLTTVKFRLDGFQALVIATLGGNFFDNLDAAARPHYTGLRTRNIAKYKS